jgi:hypothetical protein
MLMTWSGLYFSHVASLSLCMIRITLVRLLWLIRYNSQLVEVTMAQNNPSNDAPGGYFPEDFPDGCADFDSAWNEYNWDWDGYWNDYGFDWGEPPQSQPGNAKVGGDDSTQNSAKPAYNFITFVKAKKEQSDQQSTFVQAKGEQSDQQPSSAEGANVQPDKQTDTKDEDTSAK